MYGAKQSGPHDAPSAAMPWPAPSPRATWVSAAIGAGLSGAALTNSCTMGMLLSKLPYSRRRSPDRQTVLRHLADGQDA